MKSAEFFKVGETSIVHAGGKDPTAKGRYMFQEGMGPGAQLKVLGFHGSTEGSFQGQRSGVKSQPRHALTRDRCSLTSVVLEKYSTQNSISCFYETK